jgi:hypothetical protein
MAVIGHWHGPVPEYDDFGDRIMMEMVDGATRQGPWAMMTPKSHKVHGRGLGIGKGQRYKKQPDGKWLKVEG